MYDGFLSGYTDLDRKIRQNLKSDIHNQNKGLDLQRRYSCLVIEYLVFYYDISAYLLFILLNRVIFLIFFCLIVIMIITFFRIKAMKLRDKLLAFIQLQSFRRCKRCKLNSLLHVNFYRGCFLAVNELLRRKRSAVSNRLEQFIVSNLPRN